VFLYISRYEMGGPVVPPAPDAHPYPRVGLDVSDVLGSFAELRDQSEGTVDPLAAHRGPAGETRSVAGRTKGVGDARGDTEPAVALRAMGGTPQDGVGRDCGSYALHAYSEVQSIVWPG
jgi:hypothetical protein